MSQRFVGPGAQGSGGAESEPLHYLPESQRQRVREALERLPVPLPQTDAQRARNLFGARAKASRRQGRRRRLLGLVALVLVGSVSAVSLLRSAPRHVAATALAGPPAWPETDLAEQGRLSVLPGSAYQIAPPRNYSSGLGFEVELRDGALCAQVRHRDLRREPPFTVLTAELTVQDVGTAFCVEASPLFSSVTVTEGQVRVSHRGGPFLALQAGQSLRSDDPALLPVAPVPLPAQSLRVTRASGGRPVKAAAAVESPSRAARPDCLALVDLAARRSCLSAVARENSFAGENALYGLALLDSGPRDDPSSALADLRDYQRRFAQGHLAGEVAFLSFQTLVRRGETPQALAEATQFDQRFPGHPLSDDVLYQRALLVRDALHDCEGSAALFGDLLRRPLRASLRQAVAASVPRCPDAPRAVEGSVPTP